VGECFFWYRLTRVFLDKFHRAVKRLCVVCVCVSVCNRPTRSTQPCIPLRSLNQVPALTGWRNGMNVTSAVWSNRLWHVRSDSSEACLWTAIYHLPLPQVRRRGGQHRGHFQWWWTQLPDVPVHAAISTISPHNHADPTRSTPVHTVTPACQPPINTTLHCTPPQKDRATATGHGWSLNDWFPRYTFPSVLWRCWLGGRKGIRPVKNWVVGCWRGCLGWGADLHIAQQMPLPLTISCSSKSRLVLPSWFYLSGTCSPGYSQTYSRRAVKRLCVCVCVCVLVDRRTDRYVLITIFVCATG